jgi:hypothetical protein
MAMLLLLIMIALPGTDADVSDLAALTTVGKDHAKHMTNLWPEPRPRQGRVLNTYTPLTDSNIKTASELWGVKKASATSTYGLIHTWDLSQVTNLTKVWCGYDAAYCGSIYYEAMWSFNGDISMWDVAKVTTMSASKSIRTLENDLT